MTHDEKSEWRWLWREVRPVVPYQAASLFFMLSSSALGLAGPLLMKWMIDDILPNRSWGGLAVATALFFGVYVGRSLLGSISGLVNMFGVQRIVLSIRTRILRLLQSRSAAFYGTHQVGDLVQRLERDVDMVSEAGSTIVPSVVRMFVEILMTASAMIFLDWRLSSIVVPLLPLFAYLRHRYRAILRKSSEEVRAATGEQSGLLNETLTGAIQIQLLGAEHRFHRRYNLLNLRTIKKQVSQRKNELMFSLLTTSVIGLGTALIVGYGGSRVIAGAMSAGSLVAFYSYIGQIFSPMSTATELYARLTRVRASIKRLTEIEEEPSPIADETSAGPLTSTPGLIVCTDVSFDYGRANATAGANGPNGPTGPTSTMSTTSTTGTAGVDAGKSFGPSTLRGIDFDARAGERVAVVGESGCGKSSLLKLIPRLYDASGGRIEIDGRDVRALRLRDLRQAVSFVPQEPILFHGTLYENLRHGSQSATRYDMARAAWIACLTDVVSRLPNGWDTQLGALGVGLSGGEKQRVAITRALLQRRPILILDEATSALDAPTEHRILSRLERWCAGRIVIVVSHRLSAARWATRVVVMHRGEIVEDGTHDSLYRPGTHYYALWQRPEHRIARLVGSSDASVTQPAPASKDSAANQNAARDAAGEQPGSDPFSTDPSLA
jgi:ABC-type multidrug transport system fused ATPase/permease subunit